MRLDQPTLRAAAAERFRIARPDLVPRTELDTLTGLLAAKELALTTLDHPQDVVVAVVLSGLDLAAWAAATCAFALGLDAAQADAWRRSLTRTFFLAGHPANLQDRFAFGHVAGDCAWTTPAPSQDTSGLRRLLKTFEAPRELSVGPPMTFEVPQAGEARPAGGHGRAAGDREIHVAAAGVTVARGMVHVGHLLVEAVFDGHIRAGDRLTLRPLPHVFGRREDFQALRVDTDSAHPDRLRAYAALTRPDPRTGTGREVP
ncbi:DUF6182 family protein [Streptomyces sp. NBC_00320]|uniref:DUF6182 family protein n=1 Tax=Streptomyces sp. NBC_00320 TaxID=2975711 RepID=UPI002252B824|nr:DUF6182 family protein [Streptomyces sp. NBC_00320]MCX5150877.1 DUF6182 family protein [Streptomyces sp. NBC_00320]